MVGKQSNHPEPLPPDAAGMRWYHASTFMPLDEIWNEAQMQCEANTLLPVTKKDLAKLGTNSMIDTQPFNCIDRCGVELCKQ